MTKFADFISASLKYLTIICIIVIPFFPLRVVLPLSFLNLALFVVKKFYDTKNKKNSLSITDFLIICYIVLLGISNLISIYPRSKIIYFLINTIFGTFYFVAKDVFKDKKPRALIINLIVIAGFVVSMIGINQYLLKEKTNLEWVDQNEFSEIRTRVTSTFKNPNVLGEYLLLIMPFSTYMIMQKQNYIRKIFYTFSTLASLLTLILTFSRGCWLGLIVQLIIFSIFTFDLNSLILQTTGTILIFPLLPETITKRLKSISNIKETSINCRFLIWKNCASMVKTFFLTGIGFGIDNFKFVYRKFSPEEAPPIHLHNLFLQILIENGIFGLLFFLLIIISVIKTSLSITLKSNKNSAKFKLNLACLSAVCGFLVQGIFDNCFYEKRIFILWWIICAFITTQELGFS